MRWLGRVKNKFGEFSNLGLRRRYIYVFRFQQNILMVLLSIIALHQSSLIPFLFSLMGFKQTLAWIAKRLLFLLIMYDVFFYLKKNICHIILLSRNSRSSNFLLFLMGSTKVINGCNEVIFSPNINSCTLTHTFTSLRVYSSIGDDFNEVVNLTCQNTQLFNK